MRTLKWGKYAERMEILLTVPKCSWQIQMEKLVWNLHQPKSDSRNNNEWKQLRIHLICKNTEMRLNRRNSATHVIEQKRKAERATLGS